MADFSTHVRRGAYSALICIALSGVVHAQQAVVTPARRVGEYAGVRPGEPAPPPRRQRVQSGARVITWPGYEQRGGGRFFLQTTGPIETEITGFEGRFEVVLKGASTHVRNSRRWLDTRFFNTPVRRARIERRGRGKNRQLVMVFEMRAQIRPSITTQAGEGGYQYIFIDFAAGDYIPTELRRESPPVPEPAAPAPSRANTDDIDFQALDDERPPSQ